MKTWDSIEGSSYPLGVTYIKEEDAFNFAIYSRHATAVQILFYSDSDYTVPVFRADFDAGTNKSNRIWHCRISRPKLLSARYYGYRIDGPTPRDQYEWHTFDKKKILLDPYAKAVFFPPGYSRKAACDDEDNEGKAPLGVIVKEIDAFDWGNDKYIHHHHDLVIYELHIRGFTFSESSGLENDLRGTFEGLTAKIPYLRELGITAVELLPIQQYDIQADEYWGYNTLNFFCPHPAYAKAKIAEEQILEFKRMVKKFHEADIEVILDVVYNHTGEADETGPIFSFKGIDNSTYYLINQQEGGYQYMNFSGTGNTLHTRNNAVRRLILDSLHYWRDEMHVDGFRFDLAAVFNRNADGTISFDEPAVLGMINSDPHLATARFIAEPWDASGVFNLGKKFPGVKWLQWNSAYRDDIRRFVKSDLGVGLSFIQRLYGSADIFPDDLENAFHAYQSINYINCHDGFTLYDLVSYNNKHNEANRRENLDGATVNYSWNGGWEGDENLPDHIRKFRIQQAKNFCCILFLSNGTPMFAAGDEFLRTQKGNNNPYNQDNETSWLDWTFKEKNDEFFQFFKMMISFRKAHPSLSRSRFWRGDVEYFSLRDSNYNGELPMLAVYLNGSSEDDDDLYMMFNAHWEDHRFLIQKAGAWRIVINTANPFSDKCWKESVILQEGDEYAVSARSVAVFLKAKAKGPAAF